MTENSVTPSPLTAAERHDIVAALPARTAHALHALIVTVAEHNSPVTAAEIIVYDEEALETRDTAAALRHAAKLGYAAHIKGIWVPAARAMDLRERLEDRYLREVSDHL